MQAEQVTTAGRPRDRRFRATLRLLPREPTAEFRPSVSVGEKPHAAGVFNYFGDWINAPIFLACLGRFAVPFAFGRPGSTARRTAARAGAATDSTAGAAVLVPCLPSRDASGAGNAAPGAG